MSALPKPMPPMAPPPRANTEPFVPPIRVLPEISTAEALKLWHALHAKEAAHLYVVRDLGRRIAEQHVAPLTADEQALFSALTKRLLAAAVPVVLVEQSPVAPNAHLHNT